MIHAPRPATFLGNLLDILVISRRVLAKHDHSGALLDASGLDRVALKCLRADQSQFIRNKYPSRSINKSYQTRANQQEKHAANKQLNSLLIELWNDLAIHHKWLGSSRLSGCFPVTRLEGILLGHLVAKGTSMTSIPTARSAASGTAIIQPPFASRLLALVRSLGLMSMMAGGTGVLVAAAALILARFGHAFC